MHDIEKLLELFVEKGGTDVEEDVEKLGNLFRTWIQANTYAKETMLKDLKRLLTKIHVSTDNLIGSKIPRVHFFHFEKILNDINELHHRVDEVVKRLLNQGNSTEEDQLRVLKRLYRTNYINDEQLKNMEEKIKEGPLGLDEVLKQFKVGQGIKFYL